MSNIIYAVTDQQLEILLDELKPAHRVAIDLETTGLDPILNRILLLQVCTGFGRDAWVIPVNLVNPVLLNRIVKLLPDKICLAHNASFEYKFLRTHYGISLTKIYDSQIAESLLTAGLEDLKVNLADTLVRHIGVELSKEVRLEFVGVDADTWEPTQEQIEYAAQDVLHLFRLREAQIKELHKEDLIPVTELEMAAVPVFSKMELAGMYLDTETHAAVLDDYKLRFEKFGEEAFNALNPYWKLVEEDRRQRNLPIFEKIDQQIADLLVPYNGRLNQTVPDDIRLEVETLRKTRAKYKPVPPCDLKLTCGKKILDSLEKAGIALPDLTADTVKEAAEQFPILLPLLKWKKAAKIVSTYGEKMVAKISPVTGRLHSEFNQIVSTGRTSSRGPNFQNIPPDIRACFKPKPGYKLVIADYSNQELRVAAILSGDPVMLKAFEEGIDLHKYTAAMVWRDRYVSWQNVPKDSRDRAAAKSANFAVCYGGSEYVLVARGLIEDLETARRMIKTISEIYPVMWSWIHKIGEQAIQTYQAETALGRKRYFETLPAKPADQDAQVMWWKARNRIIRQAMNHPVQGSSADCMKKAMVLLDKRLPNGSLIVAMVHDELVVEAPDELAAGVAEIVGRTMAEAGALIVPGLPVPADVLIKDCWSKDD